MSQPVPVPSGSTPRSGGGCARWASGCGALLLIVLVVGGAATWWFVGRPVTAVYQDLTRLAAMDALEQRLENRDAFQPPADGLLSEAQVVRFFEAHRQIRRELAERAEPLARRLDESGRPELQLADVIRMAESYRDVQQFVDGIRTGGAFLDVRMLTDVVRTLADVVRMAVANQDVLRLVVEAVDVQAAALDTHGFSAEEYRWVRWEVLRAAGVPGVLMFGVDNLTARFTGREARTAGPPSLARVPEANRQLVAAYREEIEDAGVLARLGL